jgi:hypothetical protein
VFAAGPTVRELVPMSSARALPSRDLSALTGTRPANDSNDWDEQVDPQFAGLSIMDALFLALSAPREPGRRQLVVAFTAGWNTSVLDSAAMAPIAQHSDALLHVVLKPPHTFVYHGRILPVVPRVDKVTRGALAEAARVTGGEVHNMDSGVNAFKAVLEAYRESYVLQYTLAGVQRLGWHAVTVAVPNRPDVTVQARSGYFGP